MSFSRPNSLMSSSMGRAFPSSTSWSARLSSLAVVLSCETSMVSSSSSMRFAALDRSSFSSLVSIVVITCCSPCRVYCMCGFLNFCPSKLFYFWLFVLCFLFGEIAYRGGVVWFWWAGFSYGPCDCPIALCCALSVTVHRYYAFLGSSPRY